jgi:hypothetical protein
VLSSASAALEPLPRETRLALRVLTREERAFREAPEDGRSEDTRFVSILPEELPAQWKALEAADAVLVSRGAEEALRDEQRLTLRRRAIHRNVEEASLPDFEAARTPAGGKRAVLLFGIAYLVLVAALEIVLALAGARPPVRLWWMLAASLAFVVLFRETRSATIRESSVLRILPGEAEAYVESRIDLDIGRREEAPLEATSPAVVFEPVAPDRGLVYSLGSDERLALPGPWFRWEQESLRAWGFVATPFSVAGDRIQNGSDSALKRCSLGSRHFPDVPAGGSLSLAPQGEGDELICETGFQPGLFSFPSEKRGSSLVVFRLGPVAAEESMGDH